MKSISQSIPASSSVSNSVQEKGRTSASAATGARIPAKLKFDRILVPVDFSAHSLKAFSQALRFAHQFHAELILVHIVEQIIYPGDWMYPPIAMSDVATEKRDEIAEKLKRLGAGSGVPTREIVRRGRAWQEIVEIAKECKVDLVIVATHGYTGLRHVLLGSVAEKVVRHAPCPVFTVRADDADFS
jgi:universal stress protein A